MVPLICVRRHDEENAKNMANLDRSFFFGWSASLMWSRLAVCTKPSVSISHAKKESIPFSIARPGRSIAKVERHILPLAPSRLDYPNYATRTLTVAGMEPIIFRLQGEYSTDSQSTNRYIMFIVDSLTNLGP